MRRSVRLFRAFLVEQTDPGRFYGELAGDTVRQLERYCPLDNKTVLDIGGGQGHLAAAVRARGGGYHLVEPDPDAIGLGRDGVPPGTVVADGYWLPFRAGIADICVCSNVLEHVPDPAGLLDELVRVTRPGGLVYVSFTNWYSPWGGHETSPWHYFGGARAARRYARRHGRPPKNEYRRTLFPVHIGQTLRLARRQPGARLADALPRYYPRPARVLLRVPGLRELLTWNLLLILRKDEPGAVS
ncbi:class I SAM-dependent methyltransferase [Amycolatopsis acidicola]|uniref:Class I SAM-dependent methyltransferase n=1 Tax=Amycolatopsis acidicola TaxID=2596893 RepID=A0A5N0UL43_9PSEU|nr:class I SAM-dependent methyltransferase [Amycolatopsis acidicola]